MPDIFLFEGPLGEERNLAIVIWGFIGYLYSKFFIDESNFVRSSTNKKVNSVNGGFLKEISYLV